MINKNIYFCLLALIPEILQAEQIQQRPHYSIGKDVLNWQYEKLSEGGFSIRNFDFYPIENYLTVDRICEEPRTMNEALKLSAACKKSGSKLFFDVNHPAVGDFNGDGNKDILLPLRPREGVTEIWGGWSEWFPAIYGSESPPAALQILRIESEEYIIKQPVNLDSERMGFYRSVVADFNDDGYDDVIATNYNLIRNVSEPPYFFQGSNEGLKYQADWLPEVNGSGHAIAVGDLNHDNKPDVVLPNIDGTLNIFLNLGNGNFSVLTQKIPYNVFAISILDFNEDGTNDIAVGSSTNNLNSILIYDGLNFSTLASFNLPENTIVNDMKSWGIGDIKAVISATSCCDDYYNNHFVYFLTEDGLIPAPEFPEDRHGEGAIYVQDLDGDKDLDVLVNNGWHGEKIILAQTNEGYFASSLPSLSPENFIADLPILRTQGADHRYVPLDNNAYFGILQYDPIRLTGCRNEKIIAGFDVLARYPEFLKTRDFTTKQDCFYNLNIVDKLIFFEIQR